MDSREMLQKQIEIDNILTEIKIVEDELTALKYGEILTRDLEELGNKGYSVTVDIRMLLEEFKQFLAEKYDEIS